ncbi:MAG TPA: LytTR family DNA-binding domain-containing protein [Chitinophagaceae bacterium]|jgi:DNA-binding LytR/AlgR family response regulator|nr:LytTR family DNA-binding domain-containing protein [Chitinophagaceae bacterium]
MLYQSKTSETPVGSLKQQDSGNNEAATTPHDPVAFTDLLKLYHLPGLEDILGKLGPHAGKKSFLVFKNNKYINILTKNIAFFYIRYESPIIVTLDKQEYFVHHSLEQIQAMLPEQQFFRINRQYLINFNAVKEAEHYFARKLLVNLTIPTKEKLIVSKERVSSFLHWLDNR